MEVGLKFDAAILYCAQAERRLRRRQLWYGRILFFSHTVLMLRTVIHLGVKSERPAYLLAMDTFKTTFYCSPCLPSPTTTPLAIS